MIGLFCILAIQHQVQLSVWTLGFPRLVYIASVSCYVSLCRARATDASKVVVSPITGELIPVDQMAEHMRISLIDPKFQEQRQAMMSKIRETTKASDDEIGRNLMGLARKRPDVFGK